MNIYVTKRNGQQEEFIADKINARAERACVGIDAVSASDVVMKAQMDLYPGITTKELDRALINSARSKIQYEPNYSYVAARLLLFTVYEEVFLEEEKLPTAQDIEDGKIFGEDLKAQHSEHFIRNLNEMVEQELITPELLNYDLETLADAINLNRDFGVEYLGLQTLYDRYFQCDREDKHRRETPQAFFMRVAMGLALNEDNKEERAVEFYNQLSQFNMLSSSPTLFNAGTTKSQLSSCYLNTFDDSIDGIFDGLWQEARKSKHAGGLGFDLTPLRSRGSYIKGTNGENQGAVYFWKLYNDLLIAVNQGGKRKGAGCAYLESWHGDLEDFLALRKATGDERSRTHDMNTANWIPDLFMKQVLNEGKWYLFSPDEAPDLHDSYGEEFERLYWQYVEKGQNGELRVFHEKDAKTIWKKMLRAIFETGHPWITFKDPSNMRYSLQHEGVVHSSNLCTEILEHTKASVYEDGVKTEVGETAVCNLGSINLGRHVKDAEVQWDKLAQTIKTSIRMLDNVIDLNYYPTAEAKNSNLKHRFIGMGTMGWQDLFYMMGVNYESQEAVNLSDKIMEFISYHAILASSGLAKERGTFKTYEGSTWSKGIMPIDTYRDMTASRGNQAIVIGKTEETLDWSPVRAHIKEHGMRNALTMAIAPTATVSFIAGCSQSVEPDFGVMYVYSTLSGEFTMVNRHFVQDMKQLGLWDEDMVALVKHVDGDLSLLSDEIIPTKIKNKYKTAFNLDQKKLIDCAAARQKWLDQGQSLNLYNNQTSLKILHETYIHAWQTGLKTTYYLRNESASRVEKSTVDASQIERILSEKSNAQPVSVTASATSTAEAAAPSSEEGELKANESGSLTRVDTVNIECVGCQ